MIHHIILRRKLGRTLQIQMSGYQSVYLCFSVNIMRLVQPQLFILIPESVGQTFKLWFCKEEN